jgi:Golgi phosphoprotein 3 (GPP34)
VTTLLVQDLLLLTASPDRGTVRRPTGLALPRALAGAALGDLLAAGAASLDGDRLLVADTSPLPGPLLRHARDRLSGRHPDVDGAIEALAAPRTRLGQHVLRSLVDDGALRRRRRTLLGLLLVTSHVVTAEEAVLELRLRVADALCGPVDDPRATALASLVAAADLRRAVRVPAVGVSRTDLRLLAVAQDPLAAAVARTVMRARREAATTGAIAATAGGVVASGS